MEKLEEALWKDFNDNSELINSLEIGTAEHKSFMDERDKIRNELIKTEMIKSENHREKTKNFITLLTFGISTVVGICTIRKTFKFDEGATLTSTLGPGIIRDVTSKIFKR